MNEVFISALVNRIRADQMTIEQVPEPYKAEVEKRLNPPTEEVTEGA